MKSTEQGIRRCVLIANVLLVLVASAGSDLTRLERHFGELSLLIYVVMTTLLFAPLAVVGAIAAWGPWSPAVRAVLILVSVTAIGGCHRLLHEVSDLYFEPSELWFSLFRESITIHATLLPAVFGLIVIGSLLRLRIGPIELGPVQMTILGVMGATAILGFLIAAKGHVDYLQYIDAVAPSGGDLTTIQLLPPHRFQVDVIAQMLLAAPLGALFIALCAASYFRWWAAILVIGFPLGMGVYQFMASIGSDPRDVSNWVPFAESVSLVFVAFWIAGSVYLVHRSGWPLMRRFAC